MLKLNVKKKLGLQNAVAPVPIPMPIGVEVRLHAAWYTVFKGLNADKYWIALLPFILRRQTVNRFN